MSDLTITDLYNLEKYEIGKDPHILARNGYLTIKIKEPGKMGASLDKFRPKPIQEKYFDFIDDIRKVGESIRVWVVKPRQVGLTTATEALIYARTSQTKGVNSFIVANDSKGVDYIFTMAKLHHEFMKKEYPHLTPKIKRTNKIELSFEDIHSTIYVDTAKNASAGQKYTFQNVHLCLAGSNLILLKDGFVKKINEIKPGDYIKTHRGKHAKVIGLSKTKIKETDGKNGLMAIYLKGNTKFPIICTPNHKIFVRTKDGGRYNRGKWIMAKDLVMGKKRKGDMLGFPYRAINDGQIIDRFTPGGRRIFITNELCYLFGFYLAEGCLKINNNKKLSGFVLTVHEKEKSILSKIGGYLLEKKYIKSYKISKNKNCKTLHGTYYGKDFAEFINEMVGNKDNKNIPDFFWSFPREALKQVVKGYIDGDGHMSKAGREIYISSVRPQLLIQIRDLLISFRYGYSSLYHRDAGFYYGRNCKEIWILCIPGQTSFRLKKDLGYPCKLRGMTKHGRNVKIKSSWCPGTFHYWIPINKIEYLNPDDYEYVYDIILEHKDHSFRTITGCGVHNSEVALFDNAEELFDGLMPAVPKHPDTMVVGECSAQGVGNFFHREVMRSYNKESTWKLFFPSWLEEFDYQKSLTEEQFKFLEKTITDEELKLMDIHKATPEQLWWRRFIIIDEFRAKNISDDLHLYLPDPTIQSAFDKFHQFYPSTVLEAFVSTGRCVFERSILQKWFYACPRLRREGEELELGKNYIKGYFVNDDKQISFLEQSDGDWFIFDLPKSGVDYALGADVAEGIEIEENTQKYDYSTIVIFRLDTMEQVAEYKAHIVPNLFAEQVWMACKAYNSCVAGVEANKDGGTVIDNLRNRFGHSNIFVREVIEVEKYQRRTKKLGWLTTEKSKRKLVNEMENFIREEQGIFYSERLINECLTFIKTPEGKNEADKGCHDDLVMAAGIALQMAISTPRTEAWKERKRLQIKYRR